jgi:hypothetical protein
MWRSKIVALFGTNDFMVLILLYSKPLVLDTFVVLCVFVAVRG